VSAEVKPSGAVKLEIVHGRQRAVHHGIFFALIGKHRRSVYQNLNGEIVLGDECICLLDWVGEGGFKVFRDAHCPIDEHKLSALKDLQHSEDEVS
jgi:hypothetical protein